jgi:sirohydrochlorin ferrochelatase
MINAVLLIAHGSREPEANADLVHVANEIRKHDCCSAAIASFLEIAQPDILDGGRQCVAAGARRVVMLPYFLSAGRHVRRDLKAARDQLAQMFPGVEFQLAEPIGRHPAMLHVMMDRFREALNHTQHLDTTKGA